MTHKFKPGQVIMYGDSIRAKVIERIENAMFIDDGYPLYKIKLLKTGLEIALSECEMREVDPFNLLNDEIYINMTCTCGAKHTENWQKHSSWCDSWEVISE